MEQHEAGDEDGGSMAGAWEQRGNVLRLKSKYGGMDVRGAAAQGGGR